tara:strand:- start:3187 stop:4452 length:1266 start_codon:yes stop_codon:yes gene_type:complete
MIKIEDVRKKINNNNLLLYLFLLFPISILLGNFAINISMLLISITFMITLFNKKNQIQTDKKILLLLLFFFLSLVINLIFTKDFYLSCPRVIKIFFLIYFITSFRYLILNSKNKEMIIYKIWSITLLVVILDLIFEFFVGKNIIGLSSVMPGSRLASFTGEESVIGNFFSGFVLLFLSYFNYRYPNNRIFNFLLAIFVIGISFIIGERANFIKTFIIIFFFIIFIYEIKLRIKIFFISALLLLFVFFINFNGAYKDRYYEQLIKLFQKNGINNYLKNSQYGAHYNVAYEIFKDNPIFGVGIKNFRNESGNKKYDNLKHPLNDLRSATHPHQLHFEFLAETGIFGYLCFLIFIFISLYWSIKSYLLNKNNFQLSGILFVLISVLPLLPSGSFLSTFNSSIFWINYAIMMGYINIKNKQPELS